MASFQLPTDIKSRILKYPSTLTTPPHEKWILFEAKAGRHIGRTGMNVEKKADSTLKAVALYLPPEALSSSLSVSWQQDDYGAVYGAALERAMQQGDLPNATTGNVDNSLLARVLSAVGRGVEASIINKGFDIAQNGISVPLGGKLGNVTLGGGAGNLLTGVLGQVPNPRTDLFFKGLEYRSHAFSFTLLPRNIQEARVIDHILNTFQFYMLPSFGKGAFIGYPYEFEITMFTQRGNTPHHLNTIGRSVLTRCNINHASGTRVAFVNEIGGSEYFPASTTLQLEFLEVRLLSRSDPQSPIWHGTAGYRSSAYEDPNQPFDSVEAFKEAVTGASETRIAETIVDAAGKAITVYRTASGKLFDIFGNLYQG